MILLKKIRLYLADLFGIKTSLSIQGKILLAATHIIEEKGWTQRMWMDGEGRVCAHEAIRCAVDNLHGKGQVLLQSDVIDKFTLLALSQRETITGWNDNPGMTAQKVISTFREYSRLV
jgi:hypothetical protein